MSSLYQKIRETDKWVEYVYSGSSIRGITTSKFNKYPVIGGPLDGDKLTSVDVDLHKHYVAYSRTTYGPKQIWVWMPDARNYK